MTKIGRRDTLITLQRSTSVQDDYGEEILTWADLGKVWAGVHFGTGTERREAAREQGEQTATFNVLSNSMTRDLKITDRIALAGDNWDIVSVAPIGRAEIDLTAGRAT